MSHMLFPFLMAGLFLLSGCAPNTNVTQPDRPPVSGSSGSLSGNDTPQETLPDDTQIYDYTVAASLDMVTRGSGNENGFYQVITNENGYANLFYTDYATASRVYLCGAPNCAHNTGTCTSYIESDGFSVFPAVYKDRLFLVYSSYNSWSAEAAPSRVECMDVNGENRRTLYTFGSGITLNEGAIVGNNEIVLSGYQIVESNGSVQSVPFIGAIGMDSGTYREIYSLPDTAGQTNLFLRGVSDTGFILKTISMDDAASSDSQSRIFELSFDGKAETDLLTFSGNSCFEEHNGQELVYLRYDAQGVSLYKRSRQSEQEEQVAENVCDLACVRKSELPYDSDNLFIVGFAGNCVLLNHLYDNRYEENGNIALYYTQYAVDLTDGSAREITLYNNARATQTPLAILAKFGDSLLVDAKEEVVDGIAYRRPGIVSVEDYLNSNPAYTMIQSPIDEPLW